MLRPLLVMNSLESIRMDSYDLVLLVLIIGPCIVFTLSVLLANGLSRRRREKAARSRLRFLVKHIEQPFSLSCAWRWFFRCGYRKGKKKGLEIGRQQGQRFELVNRCEPHKSNLYPQLIRLDNGNFVQGWFCTNWDAHTVHTDTDKIEHPFAAARFAAQKELQSQLLPLTETQEVQKMPKKVKLSS
jgi:hypothetical protein